MLSLCITPFTVTVINILKLSVHTCMQPMLDQAPSVQLFYSFSAYTVSMYACMHACMYTTGHTYQYVIWYCNRSYTHTHAN